MEANIKIDSHDAVITVGMTGEIDHHTSETLREKIDKAFERSGCRYMVFDFSQVSFMDSSGVGMLIGRYKNVEKRGGAIAISGMNDELKRIFHLSGLAKIIKSGESAEEAKRAVLSPEIGG